MTLRDRIEKIRNDSDSISTFNEAQAKQSIIIPILESVNWNTHEHNEVRVEYGVGARRVDYALQINNKKVFIEAKKPGEELENHQEQLLDYSFREGVALAILTNGIAWWFYLPLKEVVWDDRKFYTIDILSHEIEDIVEKFDLLLSRENIESGKAVEHAESILEHRQREKILRESLPDAWNKIIKNAASQDSLLADLLKETVEEVRSITLERDEILRFIHSHHEKWLLSPELEQEISLPTNLPDTKPPSGNQTEKSKRTKPQIKNQTEKPKRMQIGSENYELKFGKEILVNTANWLIDKGDLKFSDCPIKISDRAKHSLIDRSSTHPTGVEFRAAQKLKNGLFIETHGSTKQAIEIAEKLLKKYEYDPKILQLEIQLEQPKQRTRRTSVKYEMTLGGVDYDLRYTYEILVNTANWLIDRGDLKSSDCPMKISDKAKRNLINRSSTHPTGVEFTAAQKLKNGLFIDTHVNTKQAIEYAKRLLEKYGYNPDMLKIE